MKTKLSLPSLLVLLAFLCATLAEATNGHRTTTRCKNRKKCTSTATSTTTSTSTSCIPTAVETKPGTLIFTEQGNPGDGTDLVFGVDWMRILCKTYCSTSCSDGTCDPACSNKGSCGLSTSTDLYISFPLVSPPDAPKFTIEPRSPYTGFTLFDITFTSAWFVASYPSISILITGESMYSGTTIPPATVIIPKPLGSSFYSSVTVNLPIDYQLGALKKIEFLPFFTGSVGSGRQGPDGRVYAEARMDADGLGSGIRFEVYRPLGCEYGGGNGTYGKREESGGLLVSRKLAGRDLFV